MGYGSDLSDMEVQNEDGEFDPLVVRICPIFKNR